MFTQKDYDMKLTKLDDDAREELGEFLKQVTEKAEAIDFDSFSKSKEVFVKAQEASEEYAQCSQAALRKGQSVSEVCKKPNGPLFDAESLRNRINYQLKWSLNCFVDNHGKDDFANRKQFCIEHAFDNIKKILENPY